MKIIRHFYVYAWLAAFAFYSYAAFLPDYYATRNNIPTHELRNLVIFSALSLIECAVLAILIRPWNFHGNRGRLALSLALFIPWLVVCALTLMHTPAIYSAHVLWLASVVVALVVALLVVPRRAA
nr:putative integron gene cassette protein [uncultured bacterium]